MLPPWYKKGRMTTKKYTVQFCACDPVSPIIFANTNSESRARKIFNDWKTWLIEDHTENGPSGEWTLWLHEHTDQSECWRGFDDEYGEYHRHFEGSIELDSFSYMETGTWFMEDDS